MTQTLFCWAEHTERSQGFSGLCFQCEPIVSLTSRTATAAPQSRAQPWQREHLLGLLQRAPSTLRRCCGAAPGHSWPSAPASELGAVTGGLHSAQTRYVDAHEQPRLEMWLS